MVKETREREEESMRAEVPVPQLTPKETRAVIGQALLAGLVIGGIFIGVMFLFLLFAVNVWFA